MGTPRQNLQIQETLEEQGQSLAYILYPKSVLLHVILQYNTPRLLADCVWYRHEQLLKCVEVMERGIR
jgi:hypothetical protein